MRSNYLDRHAIQRSRRLLSALLFVMRAFVARAFAIGMLWGSALCGADTTPEVWLERLSHSMSELDYRGEMVYTRGEHQESLRVTHGLYNGEMYERLEHLDGERREVIRHGQQLTCIQLGQRLDLLLHQHLLKAGLAGLDPYYRVSVEQETRVAGRRAVNIQVAPRDAFRYGYRLALDYDTGLLLRSEIVNSEGSTLERLQFVQIEIGQPLKKEWLGDISAAAKQARDPMPIDRIVEEEQMTWKPQWLPPGYALALAPHRSSDEVMTYSDGLAVFSVFIEEARERLPSADGSAVLGATVAYTRPVRVGNASRLIVVVGEVPVAAAKRIANSVAWEVQAGPPASDEQSLSGP